MVLCLTYVATFVPLDQFCLLSTSLQNNWHGNVQSLWGRTKCGNGGPYTAAMYGPGEPVIKKEDLLQPALWMQYCWQLAQSWISRWARDCETDPTVLLCLRHLLSTGLLYRLTSGIWVSSGWDSVAAFHVLSSLCCLAYTCICTLYMYIIIHACRLYIFTATCTKYSLYP